MSAIEVTVRIITSSGAYTEALRVKESGDNMRHPDLREDATGVALDAINAAIEGAGR